MRAAMLAQLSAAERELCFYASLPASGQRCCRSMQRQMFEKSLDGSGWVAAQPHSMGVLPLASAYHQDPDDFEVHH